MRCLSQPLARLLLLGAICAAEAAPSLAASPTVRGRILDAGGTPLDGAELELHPPEDWLPVPVESSGEYTRDDLQKTVAATDGFFHLDAPQVGIWRVVARAPGHLPLAAELVPLLEPEDLPTVRLPAARPVVVRATDGHERPVSGARVRLEPVEDILGESPSAMPWRRTPWRAVAATARTDAAGFARLWSRGRALLTVAAADGRWARTELKASDRDVVIRLREGARRIVRVEDPEGRPVAEVTALAEGIGAVGTTGEDGLLEVWVPPDTPVELRVASSDGWWAGTVLPPAGTDPPHEAPPLELTLRPPARWQGRVASKSSGEAVTGAVVWPASYPALAALSSRHGHFSLTVPFHNARLVGLAAPGFLPAVAELSVRPRELPHFTLRPAAEVRGRVVDEDGRPLERVELQAAAPDRLDPDPLDAAWARTDLDGNFRVAGLDDGRRYWLRAAAPGFLSSRSTVTAWAGSEGAPHVVVLERGVAAEGRILDDQGRPVGGARVRALPSAEADDAESLVAARERLVEATTAADGRFVLPELPRRPADLEVDASGFAPARIRGIDLSLRNPPRGKAPDSISVGTIVLRRSATVTGVVVNPRGTPLAGSRVHVVASGMAGTWAAMEDSPPATITEADGTFTLMGLAPDEAVGLTAELAGYLGDTVEVRPGVDETSVTLELRPAATVRGVVRDSDGGAVAGALVFGEHPQDRRGFGTSRRIGGATRTDGDGRYDLAGIDPGQLRITGLAEGYLPTSVRVEIPPEAVAEGVDLVLEPGARIEGTVFDGEGVPLAGAELRVEGNGGPAGIAELQRPEALSQTDGTYSLRGVAPGRRTVTVSHASHAPAQRVTDVQPGYNRLDLQLRPGASVSGRVLDAAGEAVAGASLTLVADDGSPAPPPAFTGASGTFLFQNVPPGTYRLMAEKQAYASARAPGTIAVASEPVEGLAVVLRRGGAVTGRIHGLDFETLQRVQVWASTPGLPGRPGHVDHDGRYSVRGLSPGLWTVSASPSGRSKQTTGRIRILSDGDEELLDLEFVPGIVLEGTVTRSGSPVAGAVVVIRSASGSTSGALSDAAGRFVVEDLPASKYVLTVLERGSGRQETRTLDLEGNLHVEIELTPQTVPTAPPEAGETR